mgnify:FL=1|jgi:hypothetical protein
MAKNNKQIENGIPKTTETPITITNAPVLIGSYKPLPRVPACKNC